MEDSTVIVIVLTNYLCSGRGCCHIERDCVLLCSGGVYVHNVTLPTLRGRCVLFLLSETEKGVNVTLATSRGRCE